MFDLFIDFLRFSREYILLYSLPTNPITGILYTGFALYGYSKLKTRVKRDMSQVVNKVLVFLYAVSLLGFINFCLENVWLTSFFIKYTFFNEGWLEQIYFNVPSGWFVNYLRNFVYMIVLYMIAHDVFKYVNFNKKTLLGLLCVSLYIVLVFFVLTPDYNYLDWTYAIMNNKPDMVIFQAFLMSVGGKPFLAYVFYSLFLPREKSSIDQFFEVLDVGCGATPRGTVNVDRLVPNSERHIMDLHSIPNLVVADAEYLPFKDHVFDKTLCYHMMEHISSTKPVYKEFQRVTSKQIEVRVPWHIWEKVMNKVLFWTENESFRRKHHLNNYMRKGYQTFLYSVFYDASIKVKYGYLSFLHGLKQEIKRKTFFPFPLPFELVATIDLGGSY